MFKNILCGIEDRRVELDNYLVTLLLAILPESVGSANGTEVATGPTLIPDVGAKLVLSNGILSIISLCLFSVSPQ
jgi:hypothetical protein